MAAISDAVANPVISWPRIPVRGLLGYGLSGALQVRSENPTDDPDLGEMRAIDAARGGDPDAFDVLVRRYSRRVLSIVWNVVRDAAIAEDITQDAFIRAWKSMSRFRRGERFGPWIYRIATNMAIDAVRRRTRRREEPVDATVAGQVAVMPREYSGVTARVDDALEALPEMQRIVARLHVVEEFSHREIADMTGLTEGTVRSHLSHARKKLQESLRDLYGGDE